MSEIMKIYNPERSWFLEDLQICCLKSMLQSWFMLNAWQAASLSYAFRTLVLFELNYISGFCTWSTFFSKGPTLAKNGSVCHIKHPQPTCAKSLLISSSGWFAWFKIWLLYAFVLDASKNDARRTSSHHQTTPNQKVFQHVLYIWVAIFICSCNCNAPVSLSATPFW